MPYKAALKNKKAAECTVCHSAAFYTYTQFTPTTKLSALASAMLTTQLVKDEPERITGDENLKHLTQKQQ